MAFDKPRKPRSGILFSKNKYSLKSIHPKSTSKVRKSKWKVSEKRNKVGEKYIVVKKSELSAEGTKRDIENTSKSTRPDCFLAQRSSLGPSFHKTNICWYMSLEVEETSEKEVGEEKESVLRKRKRGKGRRPKIQKGKKTWLWLNISQKNYTTQFSGKT